MPLYDWDLAKSDECAVVPDGSPVLHPVLA
jgi:hypothetical protein